MASRLDGADDLVELALVLLLELADAQHRAQPVVEHLRASIRNNSVYIMYYILYAI